MLGRNNMDAMANVGMLQGRQKTALDEFKAIADLYDRLGAQYKAKELEIKALEAEMREISDAMQRLSRWK